MSFIEIIFLAVALSLDAMIVSFSQGLFFKQNRLKNSILLAFFVGLFQFIMPITGWYLSEIIYKQLEPISKWVVFTIFMYLGCRFIIDTFKKKNNEIALTCITIPCLIGFSIATSIDALGAGISLRFSNVSIFFPALIIGIITFINSLIGFWVGNIFKNFPSKIISTLGGIILIILALKAII